MSVRVDRDSLLKIATNYGRAGKPMPDWIRNEPSYVAAYDQGTGDGDRPAQFAPPSPKRNRTAPSSPAPAAGPSRPASGGGSKRRSGRGLSRLGRAFSPSAAAGRIPGVGAVTSGGDAGGLLLALVIYPIGLASLKYGYAGIGMWFRAKWLNETTSSSTDPNVITPKGGGQQFVIPQSTNPLAPAYLDPKTGKFYPYGKGQGQPSVPGGTPE